MTEIVLIEDEDALSMGISDNLALEGHRCRVFRTGREGLNACLAEPPDLLILDLGLPDMDGLAVLETIRGRGLDFPVLVLTARSSEIDVLKGFHKGANDYVSKPFSPRILLARAAALLGRFRAKSHKLYFGRVIVDLRLMTAFGAKLSTKEFQVLQLLAQNQGEPVSRVTLLEEAWGMDSSSSERAVDTMIVELRKKIEPDPSAPRFLLTQRGIGYKLHRACLQPPRDNG